MTTYKTLDGEDYTIPGIGRTVDGKITTDEIIENPNFVVDGTASPAAFVATASQQNPAQPATADAPTNNSGDEA